MAIKRHEQMEADKDSFFNEHNLRLRKMKKEEVAATDAIELRAAALERRLSWAPPSWPGWKDAAGGGTSHQPARYTQL